VTRPDERIGPEVFREVVPRLPAAVLEVDGPDDSVVGLGVSGVVLCGLNISVGLVTT
jgi:hypothetical protein